MSAVAAPPPVVPAAPAAPAPAPIAAPQTTVHTHEDAVYNKIAAAMAAKAVPLTEPAAVAPAATPAAPAPAEPAAPAPPNAAPVEAVASPAEIDLENIDFDAPEEPAKVAAPAPDAPPAEDEAKLQSELGEAVASGDQDAIEKAFLRTARGRDQLASFKTMRELRKSPEEGGIGRIPSIEEIREADASHRTLTAIKYEVANEPVSFVSNLFTINPETGTSFLGSPENSVKVLQTIPQILLSAAQQSPNPVYSEMLAAYSAPVFTNFFNHQYSVAMAMPQDNQQQIEDKARVLDGLQIAEAQAFGQARPLNLRAAAPNGHAAPSPDPEVAALRQRLQQYERHAADTQRLQIQQTTGQVEQSAKAVAMDDIGKLLKATNVASVYSPALLNPLKAEMYAEVHDNLARLDPSGWQTYQIQLQQAARGQGDAAAATKTYRLLFQNALRSSPAVRTRLHELVQGAKSSSDAQHNSLAQAQNRVEPRGSGVPAPQSVLPAGQNARQPGESREDYYARTLSAKLSAASPRR